MELVDCTVRLGGSLQHTVRKHNITVPEIVVLKAIHGDDAVVEMVLLDKIAKRSNAAELARLSQVYEPMGEKDVNKGLLRSLFPGHAPALPRTLSEIGIDISTQNQPRRLEDTPDIHEVDDIIDKPDAAEAASLLG